MRLLHLTVLGALAVPLSVAALARAANFRTCNGRAVLPKYTPYSTVLNTCSIPFGSASADAYFHSIDEYYTQGHTVQHYGYWPSNRCCQRFHLAKLRWLSVFLEQRRHQ